MSLVKGLHHVSMKCSSIEEYEKGIRITTKGNGLQKYNRNSGCKDMGDRDYARHRQWNHRNIQ